MLDSLLKEIELNTLNLNKDSVSQQLSVTEHNADNAPLSLQAQPEVSETGRVFHGRGKYFAGYEDITVEFLSGVLLVVMFRERPQAWRESLAAGLSTLSCAPLFKKVLFQARYEKDSPVFDEHGSNTCVKEIIEEAGLKYQLSLGERQNYGFFTDMANGRRWVRDNAKGLKVLNLFSYTCSFSVAAIAGGARQVVNVDMSNAALSVGKTNHRLNCHDERSVSFKKLNILKSWSRIARLGPYDCVIVDPPSFQRGSFMASKDYPRMVSRVAGFLKPGGTALFCLNDPLTTVAHFRQWLDNDDFEYVGRIENPSTMKEVDAEVGLKVLNYRKKS